MEHAVPQNITSFEFHLVGDMTLKQFGYLAAGLVISYIIFVTIFSQIPILAVSLIVIFSLSGAAFAFLPILDRPLDHWVLAFFRAVYSPTQGFWKVPGSKKVEPKVDSPLLKNRLQQFLASLEKVQTPTIQPIPPIVSPQPPLITPPPINNITPQPFIPTPQVPPPFKPTIPPPQPTPVPHNFTPPPPPPPPPLNRVTIVEPPRESKIQIQLTSFPNVINGIITDSNGNYLDGTIVIIHDKDGIPVRALKTNRLGQFTGATPLPSGVYTVTFEKEGLEFNALKMTLNNEVLGPLQVRPKRL
ncbi:MAG: PrgI family protein [Candidatus Daviesbacteria bacterium]